MRALTVVANQQFELKDIPRPAVAADRVLVKVAYCGICGSDLPRYFANGVHAYPQVLGHEFSGIVEEVGAQVTSLNVGDRVAVAPLIPLTPESDWAGNNPAMGDAYSFIGSREQGAMADYVAVPARNCVVVPANLALDKAALVEPLTVAIHGVERAQLKAGVEVLVLGAGTIGLLTVAVLRARGVGNIVVADLNEHKLSSAKTAGANVALNPTNVNLNEYYKTHPAPAVVIETAGSTVTQKQALALVAKMGQIVYVGTMTQPIEFQAAEFEQILRKEVTLTGAWMSYSTPFPGYEWQAALTYMASGQIDVSPYITGYFDLSDGDKPFHLMTEKDGAHVKLLYKVNDLN